jgi:hypothetical protein
MEIRKLSFGRSDSPLLQLLRRILREARAVAKAHAESNPKVNGASRPTLLP